MRRTFYFILALVTRLSILATLLLCAVSFALARDLPAASPTASAIDKGIIIERVPCMKQPEQSYALYLPSSYSPARAWPIVYSFDPAARGKLPVELQRLAAERYGYILAASNNSRNGAWKMEVEAAQAMMDDTHARFSIDDHRVYFAGFSGGARLASQLATLCKCAAGVLLSGAGFSSERGPAKDVSFAVFSAIGTLDFNYREVIPLQDSLTTSGYAHWLRIFEGSHQWAPAETMEEALSWFLVQAMKTKFMPRDDTFVQQQFARLTARAASFEQSVNLLAAWREYAQIAATFDGLTDTAEVRAKSDSLSKDKTVRDALKQEHGEFEEQQRLTAGIFLALRENNESTSAESSVRPSAEEQARQLHVYAEQEKRPDRARVLKRAQSEVLVEAIETGNQQLERKDVPRAVRSFTVATLVIPQSEWAWENLAVAQAVAGDRKEALRAIKRARELATDKRTFAAWLKQEPAFDRYRSNADFQVLQTP